MTTVSEIAAKAFSGVSAEITDAIQDVTVMRTTQGAYDAASGSYSVTTSTQVGRAVIDSPSGLSKPVADIFPAYIIGPRDQLILIEGVTSVNEADTLSIGGLTYAVGAVQDILGAGSLFYVIAQEVTT